MLAMSRSRPPQQAPGRGRTSRRSAAFRIVRHVIVAGHTAAMPSDEEWEQYLETLAQACKRHGDPSSLRRLVLSDGGGPSSAQRAALVKAAERIPGAARMPGAVVSSSTFVRGIVTALNWSSRNLTMFGPTEVDRAIAFLGIDGATMGEIRRELPRIEEEIGPLDVIRSVREAYEPGS